MMRMMIIPFLTHIWLESKMYLTNSEFQRRQERERGAQVTMTAISFNNENQPRVGKYLQINVYMGCVSNKSSFFNVCTTHLGRIGREQRKNHRQRHAFSSVAYIYLRNSTERGRGAKKDANQSRYLQHSSKATKQKQYCFSSSLVAAASSLSSDCSRPPPNGRGVEVVAGVRCRCVLVSVILNAMGFHKVLPGVEIDSSHWHSA